jgi:hypothetical protein
MGCGPPCWQATRHVIPGWPSLRPSGASFVNFIVGLLIFSECGLKSAPTCLVSVCNEKSGPLCTCPLRLLLRRCCGDDS